MQTTGNANIIDIPGYTRIETQSANIKVAVLAIPNLAKNLKGERNPLNLIRAPGCIQYIKKSMSTTVEESVYQLKVVNEILKGNKK